MVESLRGIRGRHNIAWISSRINQGLGNGAVNETGVEVAQPIVGGKPFAQGAFARSRRPVDSYDHVRSAPTERINSTKPGKLVAMKALSSMRTELSVARPMTKAAIAIR